MRYVGRTPLLIAGASVAVIASVLLCIYVPLLEWADAIAAWIPDNYVVGLVLYIVCLCIWALCVPTSVPIILAGYFFGFWIGVVAVYCATTSAFSLAFWATRKIFYAPFQQWLAGKPRCRACIDSLEEGGWQLIVWMRISPIIPFHIQNYCYGASRLPYGRCLWATLIGKAPGVGVTVLIGAIARSSADGIRGIDSTPKEWWWYAMMALAMIAACYVSYRAITAARRAMAIDSDKGTRQMHNTVTPQA